MSSRQLKEELAKDQLSRSVDSTFERMHHRMGYMETRLDVALTKLQTSLDTLSTRVERMDPALGLGGGGGLGLGLGAGGRHGDVGSELQLVKTGLEELRHTVQDNHESIVNSTLSAVTASESAMQRHFERVSAALGHMQEELNRTLTVQNDGGGAGGAEQALRHERHAAGSLLGAVERHAAGFSAKVTNMYNELWRRTQVLEGLSKDAMALSNATRRELQEGMRSVAMQLSRYCSLQADKAKPGSNARDNVEATLEEIRSSMSSYFQTIISTQHMFQDTCHRIQEYEPMLEKYLAETLERIVGLLSNNKCQSQVEDLHRLLKSHHSTVVRNVGHTTNTIMRAATNSSKEAQNLATVINDAHDGLLQSTTDIEKSISGIRNEQQTVHHTLKELATGMNELQQKVRNLTDEDSIQRSHIKVIQYKDTNTESNNITSELKKLFQDNQNHINSELQNLTQTIIEVLTNIGAHLSSRQKTSSNDEQTIAALVNEITNTNSDCDDTLESGTILEANEENLNTIYDAQNPQIETSTSHNFTSQPTQTHLNEQHGKRTSYTSTPTQMSTSLYSDAVYKNNPSPPELAINGIPKSHHESKSHSKNINLSSNWFRPSEVKDSKFENHQNYPQNETFVTVIHNKPLTSKGQVIYSSQHNISTEGETNKNPLDTRLSLDNQNPFNRHTDNNYNSELNSNTNHQKSRSSMVADNAVQSENKPRNISDLEHTKKSQNTNNRNISKDTRHKNKNDTQHYLYSLINKLEELSNRLMSSENKDITDDVEHSLDSQESSEEEQDYLLPDSTFSSN